MADDALFAYLHEVIFERSELSGHPRFMAYVSGAGTIPGTVADLLAAGLNANVGGWQLSPAATEIELHLMRWFASELFGLPEGSGGLVLSGGAMANFVGLKTARDHRAGWNVRLEGLAGHPAAHDVHVDGDARGELARRRHAGDRDRGRPDDPGRRRLPDADRRAARRDRRRSRARLRAVRGRGDRGHRGHRRDRSAAGDRGHLRGGRAVVPRGRGVRRPGGVRRRPAPVVRRDRASRLDRVRSAQVALHAARRRVSRGAADGRPGGVVRRGRQLHRAGQGVHATRARPGQARAAVLAQLLGAEGVGLAAGARATGVRPTHLARRRAGALHGCARGGAAGVRAGGAGGLVDLLLPLRAARPSGRRRSRGVPERPQPPAHDRDPARRPRLHLQRDPATIGSCCGRAS